MNRGRSRGPLTLALAVSLSSCAFILDFDELQEGGAAGSAGSGGSSGAVSAGGDAGAATAGSVGADGGSAGAAGIALEDAAGALAAALCGKIESCVGSAAMKVLFFDEECVTVAESGLENTIVANVAQSQEAGTLSYDGTFLPSCIESYLELPCEESGIAFPEDCKQALDGLLPEGEDCAHSLECEAGLYCTADACPGTCSAALQEDDACTAADVCADGLTCFESACAALGGAGDECGAGVLPACLTGLICLGENEEMMAPGKCFSAMNVFVLSEGQSCSLADPPALCDVGASCPIFSVTPKCLPATESGGPCELAIPDMCPAGEYCDASPGNCKPLPGAGEPCATGIVLKPRCEAYLSCVEGTCRRLGDNGNTCVLPAECYSGACDDGLCVPSACP